MTADLCINIYIIYITYISHPNPNPTKKRTKGRILERYGFIQSKVDNKPSGFGAKIGRPSRFWLVPRTTFGASEFIGGNMGKYGL